MTPQEISDLVSEIVGGLDTAIGMVGVLDPALIPFLAIGQAADKVLPGLAKTVASWIQGNKPTDDEIAEFKQKLATLNDPNLP